MSGKDERPDTIMKEMIRTMIGSREYIIKLTEDGWRMTKRTLSCYCKNYPKEYWEQTEHESNFFNDIAKSLNRRDEDFGRKELLDMNLNIVPDTVLELGEIAVIKVEE